MEELKNAGMPERQAEAIQLKIETVREEFKRDIKELELRLTHTLTVRLGGLMALGVIWIGIL